MRLVRVAIASSVVAAVIALTSVDAGAQNDPFVTAVQDLAVAAIQPDRSGPHAAAAAAARLRSALVDWDRRLHALDVTTERELADASPARGYQLHLERGLAWRRRGRLVEALRDFDAAAAFQPNGSDLQSLRGSTLEKLGRDRDAAAALHRAWILDATNPIKAYAVVAHAAAIASDEVARARTTLGAAYNRLRMQSTPPAAPPFLVLDAVPDDLSRVPVVGDSQTAAAFAALAAGRYDDAVEALGRTGDASAADDPRLHFARGQAAEATNRVNDARHEYAAAVAATLAGRSVLLIAQARLAQVDGDNLGAIDTLRRAAIIAPNDVLVHRELAAAYAADGRDDDAFAELIAALLIDPRDADVHAAIGQLMLDGGRDADALPALTRALELVPSRYETHYAMAMALQRLGRPDDAARELDAFERARREALDGRRRQIDRDVQDAEAIRRATTP